MLTFLMLALFVRRDESLSVDRFAQLPGRRFFRAGASVLRVIAVLLFVVAVAAGLFGNQNPYSNVLPTMVWVVWWVGFAFVCALVGDLWALVNPLDTLFRWLARGSGGGRFAYPAPAGAWPAALLFLGFAWAELVWADKEAPARLAGAVIGYAAITWTGMYLYGRELWLRHGEAFSVAFSILGRFAPLDLQLRMRVPGAGLLHHGAVSSSLAVFVLLMLATVTFDGYLETPLAQQVSTVIQSSPSIAAVLFAASEHGIDEALVIDTAALLAFALAFVGAFWSASWTAVRLAGGAISAGEAARSFVLTLVPIAVAYHLSHYFSLLVTAGQFIVPLASDPFGFGWDLFGTAGYKVDLGVLSPYVFWYGAVALIVAGHVIAVWLAHASALRIFGGRRAALASQAPMLILMVAYTTLSLWILAQPVMG